MAKKVINVGITANDKKGDSLRASFVKINENFTELYNALGLNDTTLNLGAFEFTGSTISTTDSSAITIDQATTVTSNLTVGGDILPSVANGGDLGSSAKPWHSLYVSSNTIYIGNTSLGIDANGDLTLNGSSFSPDYSSIQNAPTDISELSDTQGLLNGGTASTGDVTFNGIKVIGAGTASGDGNGYSTLELVPDTNLYANDQYLVIDPTAPSHIHIRAGGVQDDSRAQLFLGGERNYVRVSDGNGIELYNETYDFSQTPYSDGADFTLGTWTAGAEGQTSALSLTTTNQQLIDSGFNLFNDSRNVLEIVTAEGLFVLTPQGFGGINGVYTFNIVEQPTPSPQTVLSISITLYTVRDNTLSLSGNDFTVNATDDIRITGADTVSLRNNSTTEPISIITDYDNTERRWDFNVNGSLTFPDATVQTTAYIGPQTSLTNNSYTIRAESNGIYIDGSLSWSEDGADRTILNYNNLEDYFVIATNTSVFGQSRLWRFRDNGHLTLPENGVIDYTPTTAADWAAPAPTTIQEAIDRLAARIKLIGGGVGA